MLLPSNKKGAFATEAEVRDILGWTKQEEEEMSSSSSIEAMPGDDDFLNTIDKNDLLDLASPETVDENSMEIPTTVFNTIPNMMVTSPYSNITSVNAMMTTSDPMMSCTNSKQTKVLLQPRVQNKIDEIQIDSDEKIQTDFLSVSGLRRRKKRSQTKTTSGDCSGSGYLTDQMPMLFAVLFMMILCLVQLVSSIVSISLSPLLLVGISAFFSLVVVTGKYVKASVA